MLAPGEITNPFNVAEVANTDEAGRFVIIGEAVVGTTVRDPFTESELLQIKPAESAGKIMELKAPA